jgi:L-threonylcarbamoyladenylate synthase
MAARYDGNPVTRTLSIDPDAPDDAAIRRAAEVLRAGGLVAFPTETVYGLGAYALHRAAVRRIFEAKGRPSTDPLIVHVAVFAQLAPLVATVPDVARLLAEHFWPGPLTLVMRRSAAVPDEVTAGLDTVAVRIPAHPIAQALLAAAAIPIAAPSANLFSRPSPTRAAHVLQDLDGRIDLVIDGGATTVGVESTVLDLSTGVPTILRPGAVTREMLMDVLPRVEIRDEAAAQPSGAMPSPGLLTKHYSPRAPLTLYEGDTPSVIQRMTADARANAAQGRSVGIVAADGDPFTEAHVVRIGGERDLATIASKLYAALRELDAAGVDVILARGFSSTSGLGVAITDRLRRAAAGRLVRC